MGYVSFREGKLRGCSNKTSITLCKTNSSPMKNGWLGDDPFLFGKLGGV